MKPNTPKPGWLEADPEDIINCVIKCIDATIANLEKLDIEPSDIVAIGLASQRCTAMAWDKTTGNLIYPGCIMAADVRTKGMVEDLKRVRHNEPYLYGVYSRVRPPGIPRQIPKIDGGKGVVVPI